MKPLASIKKRLSKVRYINSLPDSTFPFFKNLRSILKSVRVSWTTRSTKNCTSQVSDKYILKQFQMSIIKPLERGEDLRLYKNCINLQIIDILLSL